ncbi:hypothetical protein SAMN05421739_11215 [Pontibacter chinhatensis]|uniref:Uncharacterized protein n=1 Tax=Pontibacter chinhatensis TaxID=1436961 RepID=A0A1I2Z985_9BACT|nr:hypothetical protein SAMN05421739_11215 [Pontibacter chinhatensis]
MKGRDRELYTKQYPEVKKWLNQYILCQTIGYKPELPQKVYPGFLAEHIRQYYGPLEVNELGVCAVCARHLHQ